MPLTMVTYIDLPYAAVLDTGCDVLPEITDQEDKETSETERRPILATKASSGPCLSILKLLTLNGMWLSKSSVSLTIFVASQM